MASHIHIGHIQSVLAPLDAMDGHMGAPLCHNTCVGGVKFRKYGVWLSLYDAVLSLLRLPTYIDCIPHPYHLYSKCFTTLRCCEWAYGCTIPLQLGVDSWKIGAWLRPSDVVMSWLKLQTPIDCIPHPYHLYTRCLSTLMSCGWAYGCTLVT